jgi:hypothetical protein
MSSSSSSGGIVDYYAVLGVHRRATVEDIRSAYKRLARCHHPDKKGRREGAGGEKENHPRPTSPHDDDDEHFKRVSEAYQVLVSARLRRIYDKYGSTGLLVLRQMNISLCEEHGELIDFVLDLRKYQLFSILLGLLCLYAECHVFKVVGKLTGNSVNSRLVSWSWLALPVWIGFGLLLLFGSYMAFRIAAFNHLMPMHAAGDEESGVRKDAPSQASRLAEWLGMLLMLAVLLAPYAVKLACWTLTLDRRLGPFPVALFVLLNLLEMVVILFFQASTRDCDSERAGFGRFFAFLAEHVRTRFCWCIGLMLLYLGRLPFLAWYADFLLGVPLEYAVKRLCPVEIAMLSWPSFIVQLLILLPIIVPWHLKLACSLRYSWHWCLLPVHLVLLALSLTLLFVVPVLLHRASLPGERSNAPRRLSGLFLWTHYQRHRGQLLLSSFGKS